MDGSFLRFYVGENQRHGDVMQWEWLLEQAGRIGIRGGAAFRAIGSFGRHHVLHESRFFELAGSTGIEVEFIVSDDEMNQLLTMLHREKVRIVYARIPASFGVINPDEEDWGSLAGRQ